MEFVALDFETASLSRSSACEIGLVRFKDGIEQESFTTLISPHPSESFSPQAIRIHGITPDMVGSAPNFREIAKDVIDFIGHSPVVAHNAQFDAAVMAQTALLHEIDLPKINYYCSLRLAKRHPQKLSSYSLPIVSDFFGVAFEETHRAAADAEAVGYIIEALNATFGFRTLQELAQKLGVSATLPSLKNGASKGSSFLAREIVELRKGDAIAYAMSLSNDERVNNPLVLGYEFIFTGTLRSMEKSEAQKEVLKRGGFTKGNVAKSTNFLVLGSEYIEELKTSGTLSEKLNKSIRYQNQGVDIQFIDEKQFMEMLSADE